jgi:hypothetical protein
MGANPRKSNVVSALPPDTAPPADGREDPFALAGDIRAAWEHCRRAIDQGDKALIRGLHLDAKSIDATVNYDALRRKLVARRRYFPSPAKIDPERIRPRLIPVRPRSLEEDLFKITRGFWSMPYSKGYGRRLRFIVMDTASEAIIGIIGLQSPSADLACRDSYMGVEKSVKLHVANNTLDAYTVGATPAFAPLLAGKLVAGLLHSNTIRQEYWRTYGHQLTTQLGVRVPQPLLAITTASAFGRSSIYSRLKFGDRLLAKPLGYTKGFGTVHLEHLYPRMVRWLQDEGMHVPAGFGNGPKVRWQNIIRTLQGLELPTRYLEHGVRREVFIFELVQNFIDVCRSGALPQPSLFSDETWGEYWKERWCLPRSRRHPDWYHVDAFGQLRDALGFSSAKPL